MGCGRSRPRSPSHQSETRGAGDREKRGRKDANRREGKRQAAKGATKQGAKATRNGGTDEAKSDAQRGGMANKAEGVARRERLLEDASPAKEAGGKKSSGSASARAPLSPTHKQTSPNRSPANFSLLNGGSHKEADASAKNKTQTETHSTTADKAQTHASPAKPFHVTRSQQEFFKMLDERIEKGADYDSDDD